VRQRRECIEILRFRARFCELGVDLPDFPASNSSKVTDVREDALSNTVRLPRFLTGFFENNATLLTGPIAGNASSGGAGGSFACRAYSIALITLTSKLASDEQIVQLCGRAGDELATRRQCHNGRGRSRRRPARS